MSSSPPPSSAAPDDHRERPPLAVAPLDKWLATTRRLLAQERDEEVRGAQEALAALDDAENPNVLTQLTLAQWRTALFGRALLTLAFPSAKLQRPKPHAFTVGDLVQIRVATGAGSPATAFPTGIVARVEETAISIALGDREDLEEEQLLAQSGGVTIDRLANNATFAKIDAALEQLGKFEYGAAQSVVDVVFSGKAPAWQTPLPSITPFNPGLNASQLEAIRFALASKDIALIHGPPGTGKTTTVVEFILQAVQTFGMRVLVCAPSNVAVDNVLEKMAVAVDKGKRLRLTRVGHPARLAPQILQYCLDARIQSAEGTGIVNDIRKETQQMESQLKKTRDKSERFSLRRELKANRKEIRAREQKVVVELLQHSDVVFATNVGAASKLLQDAQFDLVVIDEAAQALEASCWIPIRKAPRCVLAGDHLQLPPTIKSKAAAARGLETTLFDRVTRFPHTRDAVVRMLDTQYRMHRDISDWSSRAMYGGALQSFEGVAARRLHELPHVRIDSNDELLNATLLLIDTAGCDLEEDALSDEDDRGASSNPLLQLSKSNAGEARVVAAHVRALLRTGLRTAELAVITPYNKQVQLLKALLLDEFPTLEVRSVDGFQGCEKEAVVMSLVRSNGAKAVGFLADERRMNVAITRAKRHVAVVCDTDTIRANKFLANLVDHFEALGEYRSAQEFLDVDVVHGQGDAADVAAAVASEAVASAVTTETAVKKGGQGTAVAATSSTAKKAAKTTPSAGTAEKSSASAPTSAQAAIAPAKQKAVAATAAETKENSKAVAAKPADKQCEEKDVEEKEEEEEESDIEEPPVTQKKPSLFDLLNDSDDSDESEDEREAPAATESKEQELSSATALLRDLHLSRLARQPAPPPPAPASSGNKGGKNKKKKKKSSGNATGGGGGSTVAVETRDDDEDELAFLTRQAEQSNKCCFQAATRCKKSVTTLGAVCKFCKLKFCYDHAMPEVHGCGTAVRQFERQQFQTAASSNKSDTKKLSADKRRLLQKKLDEKVTEQSASRQTKAKPKAKKN